MRRCVCEAVENHAIAAAARSVVSALDALFRTTHCLHLGEPTLRLENLKRKLDLPVREAPGRLPAYATLLSAR